MSELPFDVPSADFEDSLSTTPESTKELLDELDKMFDACITPTLDDKPPESEDDKVICIKIKDLRYFVQQELRKSLKPYFRSAQTPQSYEDQQSLGEKQLCKFGHGSFAMSDRMASVQKWVDQQKFY